MSPKKNVKTDTSMIDDDLIKSIQNSLYLNTIRNILTLEKENHKILINVSVIS